jgi:GT2 family glycosyltransferase
MCSNRLSAAASIFEHSAPELSVVLLTFNRWDRTSQLLRSFLADRDNDYSHTQLVWIENGSSDATPVELYRWIARYGWRFHSIVVHRNARNVGFIMGVNMGIDRCQGQYICLINSDAVVSSHWRHGLLRQALTPHVAAVGPVSNGMPWNQSLDHQGQGVREVPVLYGFCLLTRQSVLDEVGLLDERYGLGVIEVEDWCERARRTGMQLLVDTDVVVRHDEPHASYTPRTNSMLHVRNRALFERKWGVGPYYWGNRSAQPRTFAKSVACIAEAGVPDIGQLHATLRHLPDDWELLVVARRSEAPAPQWLRIARADSRLNVVRVRADWPDARLDRLCAANARGRVVGEFIS